MKWILLFLNIIITGEGYTQISTEQQSLVLKNINSIRAKGCTCGGKKFSPVKPLTINEKLNKVSQSFAKEMGSREMLSHTGRNGSKAGGRIKSQGYNWSYYGENIAGGYSRISEVVLAWLNSPTHCKTLMNPNYIHIGIGYFNTYWVTDFATPKNEILE